ncbi:mannose-6-phosphate isomerase, class I [Corynebacterium sp. MSK044]|uniref:mannose-6-phosphate isomerase, class I n=1 Tax=Corynebacterium sp. MSK044 TaxID=3050195 RepID=UPI00254F7999|nr:mannose-6-phosphate isomerase, class I [Corynebacterium sp. MSK044]MDK8797195.1 mannose-6-phosphate isomerase, class I [Corynebacterium sp. MSK044]
MLKLTGILQHYAWGDTSSIAMLQGRKPGDEPEAELWFGAHPSAPSGTTAGPLDAVIAANPVQVLGEKTATDWDSRLPFLVKLLAAKQPLSIQAHPSIAQAKEGFAREDAAGIPRDASHRNYKDENHKPEILVALTPFRAMAGFRPIEDTVRLLEAFEMPELDEVARVLVDGSLEALLRHWLNLDTPTPLVDAVIARAGEIAAAGHADPDVARLAENIVFIGQEFSGDVGVLAALLLNHIVLEPGGAVFLPAGNLHAYLEGFGVEVMANSDNVLRGGLTSKHIDVDELMDVLIFSPIADPTLDVVTHVEEAVRGSVRCTKYPVPVKDFAVSRYTSQEAGETTLSDGPAIVLVVAGQLELDGSVALGPGEAAFIAADDGAVAATWDGVVDFFVIRPG